MATSSRSGTCTSRPAGAARSISRHHLIDFDLPLRPLAGEWQRTATALREVAFLLWLVPFVWRTQASIVTATNPYLQGLNAAIVAGLLDLPYAVIVTRDYDWDWQVLRKQAFASVFPSRRIERAIGRWVLRHARLVLADREYYRRFALRNGAVPERTIVTRVLADRAYADARPRPALPTRLGLGSGPLLMYVGRLDADKFVLDLIDCLALVRKRFPAATLVCAGTGSLAAEMHRRACDRGVGDGLRLLGPVDLQDLPDLIASSSVVVAPHMGYTLVEAGLTGVPVVTYDFDFHGEIIENGISGYLAPLRDVRALAECVSRVLADPGHGAALGARLRERLMRDHSLEAVVPLYQRAYDLALSNA